MKKSQSDKRPARTATHIHKKRLTPALSSRKLLVTSFLAGASALIYELVCQRYLALILGSEAYVVAVTVGFYMVGLSAGSIIFGALSDKNRRLALYLSVFGFALFCGVTPLIYMLINGVTRLGSMGIRLAGCLLFMLPATICAGGVIPCLIKTGSCIKNPAYVYAAYTLGSIAGTLICGYLLIRLIGISATALLAAGMSLLCGALMYRNQNTSQMEPKSAKSRSNVTPEQKPKQLRGNLATESRRPETNESVFPVYTKRAAAIVIAAYCVSGFASMVFQVFQTKILTLFFRDSVYDFTVILTVYLVGLFAGNIFGGRIAGKRKNLLRYFAFSQALAGVAVIIGLYIVNAMPAITYDITSQTIMNERYGMNAFVMSNVLKAGYTAPVVLIPTFLWGMGFPLVNKITTIGGENAGRITGLTLGINTLFCAAGSLLSAFWLVDVLGIKGLILLSGIVCVVTGTAATLPGITFLASDKTNVGLRPTPHRVCALSGRNESAIRTAPSRRFAAHRAYARCLVRFTTCFLFMLRGCKRTNQPGPSAPEVISHQQLGGLQGKPEIAAMTVGDLARLNNKDGEEHKRMSKLLKQILPIACLIVLTAVLLIFLPRWDRFEMSTSFLKPGQDVEGAYNILYYDENAYGVISVVDFLPTNQKFLTTNRRFCQNSSEMYGPEDHRRLGIIPLLIHDNPKDVLAVGLGAGITLGGANQYPGVNIDCVEISGSVVRAASYFGEENGHVLDADNVRMIIDDGRNYIKNADKTYDVIIADIFFPMSSGSSSLFSQEYYEMCKNRLNPGGIMTQWIPVHQFSTLELNITIKTFASVFDNSQLWYGLIGTSIPVIGIVGSEKPVVIDGDRLAGLYKNEVLLKTLSEIALDDKYMMLSHFIADVKDTHLYREDIRISTDDKPILEYLNPGNNTPYYQKGEENLFYVSALKSAVPQTGFCKNVDEVTLEYYNTEILSYIDRIFAEEPGQ